MITISLFSAYLTNMPITVTQPDDSELHCFASGDEYYNWLHDEKGFTIIRNSETGYYSYAILRSGMLEASGYIAGFIDPETVGLVPEINLSAESIGEIRTSKRAIWSNHEPNRAPTTGELNNLVVYIRFSDQNEYTDSFYNYDNGFNASTGVSMKNYFTEVSDGQLDIATYFYPAPSGNNIFSYQDSHSRSYFEVYDANFNPNGYQGNNDRRDREHTLLVNAVNYIASAVPVDLDLDNDGDGKVDNVCFFIQGGPEGWAELLWPHMWSLYSQTAYINGSRVYTYNFQLSDWFGVSVLCHEMFHSLGAPDLYRYQNSTISPVGSWDLMASNSNPPQHMGAYMKYKYGEWFSTLPEITSAGAYILEPLSANPYACYKINSPNSATEFFLLEYRKDEGIFEYGISSSGLLIYRINPIYNGNAYGPPDEVYVYRPGGTLTINGNISQAPFASNYGRTEINDTTDPSSFLSTGNPGGLEISSIGSIGSTIQFFYGQAYPQIAIDPVLFTESLLPDDTLSRSLSISNTGDIGSNLNYSISISPSRSDPVNTAINGQITSTRDWLSVDPSTGLVAAGSSDSISVDFNSAGLTPGVYTADLIIDHNAGDPITIPVSLNVATPELIVTGVISFEGLPFENVLIIGNNTSPDSIITSADGSYSFTAAYSDVITITPQKQYYNFDPIAFQDNITSNLEVNFTAIEWAPNQPQNGLPEGSDIAPDVDQLSWDAPIGGVQTSYYKVVLSVNSDYSDPLLDTTTEDNFYSLSLIELDYEQTYYISVTAHYTPPERGDSTPLEWLFTTVSENITLSGYVLSGITPVRDVIINDSTITDNNGFYSLELLFGSDIIIEPQKVNHTFTPETISFNNIQSDIEQNFQAIKHPPPAPVVNNLISSNNLIELSWDPVPGAIAYRIYSSDNPYSGFVLELITLSTFWSGIRTDEKRFYRITATN